MNEATQEGVSVTERLEAMLNPTPEPEQTENAATPEAQPEPEAEASEAVEAEAPEVEAEQAETEEPADEEPEADDAEGEDEEAVEYDLSDVAKLFGVDENSLDVNDDGEVIVKTKIDGEAGTAKLQSLLKSYQLEGHLNRQNTEVVEQRKAIEVERQEFQQASAHKLQALEDTLAIATHELNRDFQGVNWAELEAQDPSRFAAERVKFADRQTKLQQAAQVLDGQRQEAQQVQAAAHQQMLEVERSRMLEHFPNWSNPETFQKESDALKRKAIEYYDIPDEQAEALSQMAYHWGVRVLKDAVSHQELQQAKPKITKKVRKAPKVARPGAHKPGPNPQDAKSKESIRAFKKSGGKRGLAQALLDKGIV